MLKSKAKVGDLVRVCVNTENDAFDGLVLGKSGIDGWWYQVKACDPNDMPGKFWFRENKIVKVYGEEQEKAAATKEPVGAQIEQSQKSSLQGQEKGKR